MSGESQPGDFDRALRRREASNMSGKFDSARTGYQKSVVAGCALSIGGNAMYDGRNFSVRIEGAKYGVSFGSSLAMVISYNANHSILWAIIHGILSWLYVIYYALFH